MLARLRNNKMQDFNGVKDTEWIERILEEEKKRRMSYIPINLEGVLETEKSLGRISEQEIPDFKKEYKEKQAKMIEDDMELERKFVTGNYDKEKGTITLYRYVNGYEGFEKVISGDSDLLPPGYSNYGTEEELKRTLRDNGLYKQIELIENFRKGRDISDFLAQENTQDNIILNSPMNPVMFWTALLDHDFKHGVIGNYVDGNRGKPYRIKAELFPNEAFRCATKQRIEQEGFEALQKYGLEAEWRTVGPIDSNRLTIEDQERNGEVEEYLKLSNVY